jgi:hypothetical protein
MSAVRFGKHPVLVWLSSLMAVLLLYVLAFPPLLFWFGELPYHTSHRQHPRWLMHYTSSHVWIAEHTPLKKPMRAYLERSIKRMRNAWGIVPPP